MTHDYHHPKDYRSSGSNAVMQPDGKTYIKNKAAAPPTCNKEQYTGNCANSTPVVLTMPQPAVVQTYHPILPGSHSGIVTRHAINALTKSEIKKCQGIFAPHVSSKAAPARTAI